jgi:alkaline phosphatase
MFRRTRTATTLCLLAAITLTAAIIAGCADPNIGDRTPLGHDGSAKYVFLFVGDGMGPAQVHATEVYRAAVHNQSHGVKTPDVAPLVLSRLPVHGACTTYSWSSQTTDSAASGTALATGFKTNNGMVSMTPDLTPVATLGELAKARGMKVGIISDVPANHATPAVFYAHQESRGQYHEIAMQIADSCVDLLAGSSLPNNERTLDLEAIAKAEAAGFRYVTNRAELDGCRPGDRVLSITPAMTFVTDRKPEAQTLANLTRKATELLDGPGGFFIMVEAGRIDWTGHANDAKATIDEVQAFDDAVAAAMEFYRKHPTETLIVVTADHETGGMSLASSGKKSLKGIACLADQTRTYGKFNEVFFQAWKVANEHLWSGAADNIPADLKQEVEATFGFLWDDLGEKQVALLEEAYDDSMGAVPDVPGMYGKREAFPVAIGRVVSQRAGIGWTTFGHSPMAVPVRATGACAYRFGGFIDNTQIAHRLAEVMRVELQRK